MSTSLRYFTRRNALNATTQSAATTHFNHLRSIPRAWLIRRSKHDPKLKSVRPADRIKWWNIVPGDQVRLRGDKTNTIREVLSINRLSNRVFLKGTAVRSVILFHCTYAHRSLLLLNRKTQLIPTNLRELRIIITQDASCT